MSDHRQLVLCELSLFEYSTDTGSSYEPQGGPKHADACRFLIRVCTIQQYGLKCVKIMSERIRKNIS